MTITNLPSYPQQYISTQYHIGPPAATSHPHPHAHPSHTHVHHHQPHHSAYPHHPHHHPQTHLLTGPVRTEPVTRKRPKYTRSKTGCLTCRVKKIKCDETKPTCTRCTHGQRECNWPENVPARKKPTSKRNFDGPDRTLSPESASPSSSAPTTAREGSPERRSPHNSLHPPDGSISSRRTHSEPNTAAASPIVSPIDSPNGATSRRPSLSQSVRSSSSSLPYTGNSHQMRQQHYPSLTPPNVSPAPFHPSPSSSHEYSSYNGSPPSNGHGSHGSHGSHSSQASAVPRHELSSGQSRISDLGSVESAHNLSQWQPAPMMTSAVDSVEPYFRTVQDRNLVGRSSASYAS